MADPRFRVAHVVPALGIGGVEVGIVRSLPVLRAQFDYRVFFVRRPGELACGQRSVVSLCADILRDGFRPDAVITSLWWSHPVGELLRLTIAAKWLAFFHNAGFVHGPDRISQRMAWSRADVRLADSEATRRAMSTQRAHSAHLVPYVFLPEPLVAKPWREREVDITWVGRSHPVKRLDLVASFLRELAGRRPGVRITLIVAGEAPSDIVSLARDRGIHLSIVQNASEGRVRDLLGNSRSFLLLSDFEGMSMATVEAVQAGCLVVTRPVGEIPAYIGENSGVLVHDTSREGLRQLAERVSRILDDEPGAMTMIARASASVSGLPTYADSLARVLLGLRDAP